MEFLVHKVALGERVSPSSSIYPAIYHSINPPQSFLQHPMNEKWASWRPHFYRSVVSGELSSELKRITKEAAVAHFEVLLCHLPGGLQSHENTPVTIGGCQAGISIRDIGNSKEVCYSVDREREGKTSTERKEKKRKEKRREEKRTEEKRREEKRRKEKKRKEKKREEKRREEKRRKEKKRKEKKKTRTEKKIEETKKRKRN